MRYAAWGASSATHLDDLLRLDELSLGALRATRQLGDLSVATVRRLAATRRPGRVDYIADRGEQASRRARRERTPLIIAERDREAVITTSWPPARGR